MADEREAARIDDLELDTVSGGTYANQSTIIKNKAGKEIGWYVDGEIIYFPCPKCGRPTYTEWCAQHCDPCDDYWFFSSSCPSAVWYGSAQSLIEAFG